ncbi:hypothetical protein [Microbacterium sp. R86528]|uniref:hypothetical protein n=1 Tax=Microbacterium sp. R86528 TaxID=3093864 RepID=UPI0037C65D26
MSAEDVDYYQSGHSEQWGGITENEIVARGRNLQMFDPATVALIESRVRQARILEQFEKWAKEDGAVDGVGGRPVMISLRALLTALLLLAHEGSPLHISRAALVLQHRLAPESRDLLDLPHAYSGFASHVASNRRWYTNTIRAFHRMKDLMDPFPQERYTAKTYEQIQEILAAHDPDREEKYKARLNEYTRLFLQMTFMNQPRHVRRVSNQLDVSFDQTYIGTPTTKGYSRKNLKHRVAEEQAALSLGERTPGPVDAFAGWHVKSGKAERVDNEKGEVDQTTPGRGEFASYDWGWEANLAVRVDAEEPGSKRFPTLVVAASLSIPNMEVAEEAVHLLQSAARLGLKPGIADADKQYFANSKPFRLLKPALKAGFTPSTDYRVDRMGVKGGEHGGLFVEGDVYCPNTPAPLLSVSKDFLSNEIDAATFRARREERKAFRLHVKQKAKGDGKTMLRCPAMGPSPTVTCPLRELALNAAQKARPHVEPETLEEEFIDTICKQHSAAFDLTQMQSPPQAFDYGSEEWEVFHDHARNSVESENQQLKASGDEDIATAARRKVRGLASAQIIVTLLLVTHNIRKIAAFLSDKERDKARTTPRVPILRRRDRAWANRYTRTTGDGDMSIPGRKPRNIDASPLATSSDILAPMRT